MDTTWEYYKEECSILKNNLLEFKERYKNLVKNTSNILNNLNKKESIYNFKRYLVQKKYIKQLKIIYKNELENLPKTLNIYYDVKEIRYNLLKQKITSYIKCIKKYKRHYERYLNRIRQYIIFYNKNFVGKNECETFNK